MTVQGEVREVTAQIARLVWAEGKDGSPQWEVQVRWPWTPAANKGGDKTWVSQGDFPAWTAATKGAVNLEVVAGPLRKAAEGKEPYDGHLDWMWLWYIRKVLDHTPSASPPKPHENQVSLDQRIAWNSAVNNATNLVAAAINLSIEDRDQVMDWSQGVQEAIKGYAQWYYELIQAGTAAGGIEEPHQNPAQPAQAPLPSTPQPPAQSVPVGRSAPLATTPMVDGSARSLPDPWDVVRASLEQYNADLKAGARKGRVLLLERDVEPRVDFKFGDRLTMEQAAEVAAAIAKGSMPTWPAGAKR